MLIFMAEARAGGQDVSDSRLLRSSGGVQYKHSRRPLLQFNRAATPHTITGPALPNGAPLGPVM